MILSILETKQGWVRSLFGWETFKENRVVLLIQMGTFFPSELVQKQYPTECCGRWAPVRMGHDHEILAVLFSNHAFVRAHFSPHVLSEFPLMFPLHRQLCKNNLMFYPSWSCSTVVDKWIPTYSALVEWELHPLNFTGCGACLCWD